MTGVDQVRPRGGRLPRKARRAQLLDSALEVFVAQGYHAAAMDDIAERAGVSKPVLYQHFPGKLELYLALLEQSSDRIIDATRARAGVHDDNKQRVLATMKVFYDYVANAQGAFRLVFESDLTNEPAVRAQVDRVTDACADEITKVIHEDTGLSDEAVPPARGLPGRHGPGQRPLLAATAAAPTAASTSPTPPPSSPRLAWRGICRFPLTDEPDREPPSPRPRLTHRLGALGPEPERTVAERPAPDSNPEGARPWRSRSACRTSPASSSSRRRCRRDDVEKAVTKALSGDEAVLALDRRQGSPRPRPERQARLRRGRRPQLGDGRLPPLTAPRTRVAVRPTIRRSYMSAVRRQASRPR